jgi:ribonuclease VapC
LPRTARRRPRGARRSRQPREIVSSQAPVAVLDASALLAVLHGERGADAVEALLASSVVSAVNWAEVTGLLQARGVDAATLREDVEGLGPEIVEFSADDADLVGSLLAPTRHAGLSLGDRACLALARHHGVPAVTTDRAWESLDLEIEIRCVR